MANQMNMKVGAGIVTFLAVFAFFVAAICTLGGQQRALATRKFGDVSVDGELDLNGYRTKTYTQTYSNLAAINANNSIGPIQGGFTTGHFIVSGSVQVTVANAVDLGAVNLACATPANAVFGQTPANTATGVIIATTNNVETGINFVTGQNTVFSTTLTTLCATGTNPVASSGTMTITATVVAVPGAPTLP